MNDFLALFEQVHDQPKSLMSLTRAHSCRNVAAVPWSKEAANAQRKD
jgi:hypothetical protein